MASAVSTSFGEDRTLRTKARKRPFSEISSSSDFLHSIGYKVYKTAIQIPKPIMQEVIRKSQNAPAIFNHNESAKNDNKRRQYTLSMSKCSKVMREFIQYLNQFIYENISESLIPATWVSIHSRPGCQDQAAHCDYIPDLSLATVSDKQMPLAVLVSMMPGTRLNVWPKSIKLTSLSTDLLRRVEPIRCEEVELDAGDVLIFRGDLVHAGSSYENDNYRLHTFLDSHSVHRKRNRTWIVHIHGEDSIKDVILPK